MITYIVILWCIQLFTVSSTLLCPELYCVQHITVSNTLLCQAKYCVHTYPKVLLSTFHISTCCGHIMCLRSTSVKERRNKFDNTTIMEQYLVKTFSIWIMIMGCCPSNISKYFPHQRNISLPSGSENMSLVLEIFGHITKTKPHYCINSTLLVYMV